MSQRAAGSDDGKVQATNDEATVSKRSAARAGYFTDARLRPFVRKARRRAALVNRGYWLRVHAVRDLARRVGARQLLVLGAGFDTLALAAADADAGVRAVEVDLAGVVARKCALLRADAALRAQLDADGAVWARAGGVRARHYSLVAGDLRDLDALDARLADDGGVRFDVPTLIVAECVLTYLAPVASDAVVRWMARRFERCAVLSYGQVLPDDAFGRVMRGTMRTKRSPVHLERYPTAAAQRARYVAAGFDEAATHATDLADYWRFGVPDAERRRVAALETFDEFEEWHHKLAHYHITTAAKGMPRELDWWLTPPDSPASSLAPSPVIAAAADGEPPLSARVAANANTRKHAERWGASLCVLGGGLLLQFGGYGGGGATHARLNTLASAEWRPGAPLVWHAAAASGTPPDARLHHAVCALGADQMLLHGGRASPSAAKSDVFVLRRSGAVLQWHGAAVSGADALLPRWRHSLTALDDARAIVAGGRVPLARGEHALRLHTLARVELLTVAPATAAGGVAVSAAAHTATGAVPAPRCAHAAVYLPRLGALAVHGGLGADERALDGGVLHLLDVERFEWRSLALTGGVPPPLYSHTAHVLDDAVWLVGGASDAQWPRPALHCVRIGDSGADAAECRARSVAGGALDALMLCKHASVLVERELITAGGGAVCFSFGSHFDGVVQVRLDGSDFPEPPAAVTATAASAAATAAAAAAPAPPPTVGMQAIPIVRGAELTEAAFRDIVARKRPVVFRGLDFGSARERWTREYLRERGGGADVSVHWCESARLDFLARNYEFRVMPFADMVDAIYDARSDAARVYLRSVGANPRKDVSDVWAQWPTLCGDGQLRVPAFMAPVVVPNRFSSVLRAASAGLWVHMHYDVCDNILIGVRGRKRCVLFAPRDVGRLYVDGSTSRIGDVDHAAGDAARFPRFAKAYARRHECTLAEGDVLYIPALWLHTTHAAEPAVSVNVFWRDPDVPAALLNARDLYGNADPLPAARLQRELAGDGAGPKLGLAALLDQLAALPAHYRDFYARKLTQQLKERFC